MLTETHLRAFFAIEINDELREITTQIINALRIQPDSHNVKWIAPHKLHITLRFLGQVDNQQINQCAAALTTALKTIPPFTIQADKLFNFPAAKPRIIALHFPLTMELANLYKLVETACHIVGFQTEKHVFLPHLTLGRMSSPIDFDYTKLMNNPFPALLIQDITLFHSELRQEGSVYKVLQCFPLG